MQPRRILIVDDSRLIHKMMETLLRQFSLAHAMDGLEGLEQLQNHRDIDLILLDINMPRMDGMEFLHHIKANPAQSNIPVIIIGTEGTQENTVRALEAGAAGYINKPFGTEELLDVIQRL